VKVFGATGLAKAKFRTMSASPGIAEPQLGPPNRMNAELELGDPRKKCAAAQETVQELTIEATTCNVCDGCDEMRWSAMAIKN